MKDDSVLFSAKYTSENTLMGELSVPPVAAGLAFKAEAVAVVLAAGPLAENIEQLAVVPSDVSSHGSGCNSCSSSSGNSGHEELAVVKQQHMVTSAVGGPISDSVCDRCWPLSVFALPADMKQECYCGVSSDCGPPAAAKQFGERFSVGVVKSDEKVVALQAAPVATAGGQVRCCPFDNYCIYCDKLGHFSSDCPVPRSRVGNGSGGKIKKGKP